MFDGGMSGGEPDSAADLGAMVVRVAAAATRVDRIRAIEELIATAAAAKAREVAAFAAEQETLQRARGVAADEVGRGVAAQVGLAMRASHHAANRFTGFARVLVAELPHTLAALARGETTERRAFLVAQHTIWLSAEDRAAVDARIGPRLEALGDRQVEAEVKKLAYQADKAGYVERQRRAENERRVTVRPAPDTMAYLTALLPVASAVTCQAKLQAVADSLKAGGDPRSRGQLMADALVGAVACEISPTDGGLPSGTVVEIKLVMGDAVLFGGDEPAHLEGYGPVPAAWVRDLLRHGDDAAKVWLRRLFTAPQSGALAGIETQRREFTGMLRELIIARDQFCRTPWCGAPIRHIDHVQAHSQGGPTSLTNGQGLCEACNYAKQASGWQAESRSELGEPHFVYIITPTGHRYTSRAPDPPGWIPVQRDIRSPFEVRAERLVSLAGEG